jgi:Cdc6-like AAA superfamily ATPase
MNHDDTDDNDRLADRFEQYRDDETTDHNAGVFGKVGTGKTERLVRHARHHRDDSESVEFIDPKGEEGEEHGG